MFMHVLASPPYATGRGGERQRRYGVLHIRASTMVQQRAHHVVNASLPSRYPSVKGRANTRAESIWEGLHIRQYVERAAWYRSSIRLYCARDTAKNSHTLKSERLH